MKARHRRSWLVAAAVVIGLCAGCGPTNPSAADRDNDQAVPNAAWALNRPATDHQIEGYASATSVPLGGAVSIHVSTTASAYTGEVLRMGWASGAGATLAERLPLTSGHLYPMAAPSRRAGTIEDKWPSAFTIHIPTTWAPGVYMVRLLAANGYGAYVPFVVRSPQPRASILFVHAALTDEAYNAWGGKSLYDFNSDARPVRTLRGVAASELHEGVASAGGAGSGSSSGAPVVHRRASEVSFDRPFAQDFGAGNFFKWEYPMIRFLERRHVALDYASDLDVAEHPAMLRNYRAVVIVGHDEYWSRSMRNGYDAAVAHGVSLAVFAADTAYWQVRLSADGDGRTDRRITCYKSRKADPLRSTEPRLTTVQWRQRPVSRPESELLGAMYVGDDFRTYSWHPLPAGNPMIAKAGLTGSDEVPGMLGYEIDRVYPNRPHPSGVHVLSRSPVRTSDGHREVGESTLYRAPSGALVFDGSTMQWSWALDPFVLHHTVRLAAPPGRQGVRFPTNAGVQKFTLALLQRMLNQRTAA